ncbi:mercury(II) reductase [Cuniculiplasma sp. SKW3]|uniref:mercury(II) reductase n=1 Tax=Cuniculiplasma sp. SKW3 TaxID=3400170 RepID=UPI003FCF2520
MPQDYDLVIIGRGAAAFSAAIRASEITSNQATIAMIGFGPIGGTCVNVGCVPSKYIIEASKVANSQRKPKYPGIRPVQPEIDFIKLMESLREAVKEERRSKYEDVLKFYPNITLYEGKANFISEDTVRIRSEHGDEQIRGYNFIIATGSRPFIPKIEGLEDTGYLTSENVWDMDKLPSEIGIIGGGFVGLEIGQALRRLGSHVTIIKRHDTIGMRIEREIGTELMHSLEDDGISFLIGRDIKKVYRKENRKIILTDYGGKQEEIVVDEILIASGRSPSIEGLSLENAGVQYSDRGIKVNRDFSTTNPKIYAAGDVVDQKYKLETLAAREGATIAHNIFNNTSVGINIQEVPWAIFTEPQLASVGYTEDEYNRNFGRAVTRILPLNSVPKARILREERGMFKIVADEKTGKIVGIHVLAPYAAEFIMEGVIAIKNGYTYRDIIVNSHIFPTVAEGVKLASQSFTRDVERMSCCVE